MLAEKSPGLPRPLPLDLTLHLPSFSSLVLENKETAFCQTFWKGEDSVTRDEWGNLFIYLPHIELFQRVGRWSPTKQPQPHCGAHILCGNADNKQKPV